jgi:NAD+ kinase
MRVLEAPASIHRAVLLTHTDPSGIALATAATAGAAKSAGCELLSTADELRDQAASEGLDVVDELPGSPDICIVLGGDGTILRALRLFTEADTPVFGINFGTVGFLAAAEREDLDSALESAFAARFDVIELPGLELNQGGPGALGLNDVAFLRKPHGRVAELSYMVSGQEVGGVRCDGLVAATPAGSTGYNLANQGPILAWGVEGFALSFVAPHTFTARPLVVAPNDVLRVRNSGREPVDIAIDGQPSGELAPGEEAEVRFRGAAGRLAQLPGASFYRRVRQKFGLLAR